MARKPISEEFWTWQLNSQALGAIAAGSALVGNILQDASREHGCRLSKLRWMSEWTGKTAGEGPIWWGFSWGLTQAEVIDCMTADPQFDIEADMVPARRNLVVIGYIPRASTVSPLSITDTVPSFRTKRLPSWDVPQGTAVNHFQFVPSNGVSLTSGTVHHMTLGIKQGWLND